MNSQENAECIGQAIVEELKLKPDNNFNPKRYHLKSGSKTNIGLYLTIVRILEEHGYKLFPKE